MTKKQAEKKIIRKLRRVKICPFCGDIPFFNIYTDERHSENGSFGHYAIRKRCCPATGTGQTELFFCNSWKKPNYNLWWKMASRLIDDWNRRSDGNS